VKPFEHVATFNSTSFDGYDVLRFTSPPQGVAELPVKNVDPPFFVDYYGAVKHCRAFLEFVRDRENRLVQSLVFTGQTKTGKSTLLYNIFPAEARAVFPDCLFWTIELRQVSAGLFAL
jgi:hypothetical protein